MFLTNSHRGHTRDGQQRASGQFLILFSHNTCKDPAVPVEDRRKVYAHVCHVSMKQLGQFMMGESKTLQVSKAYGDRPAPNNLILSGTYGDDGLTCDYEDLTAESRAKLVLVPVDLAEKFWHGGGWNSAGSEAQDMRDWAVKTFKVKERKVRRW
jgi:hypothetical protein